MKIHSFIVGRGMAGRAIAESLAFLKQQMPEIELCDPVRVQREERLRPAPDGLSIAFIANPHALHADRILEAQAAGFNGIVTEKPVCVSLEQAKSLETVATKTAVLHGYRQMWGPQTIRGMIGKGELGKIISIEGRYWQSSEAERGLAGTKSASWKNSPELSGPSDVLLDLGTHWADLAVFLAGISPTKTTVWTSHVNAATPHRDTHVHIGMEFGRETRAFGSVSKTVAGAGNHLEVVVIGGKASATWNFSSPDEIVVGSGRDRKVVARRDTEIGSRHAVFHGAGWLEGYIEVIRQLVSDVADTGMRRPYPSLPEALEITKALLRSSP